MTMLEKINQLRARSGEGMCNCKSALVKAEGNMDVAYEYLRLKSQAVVRAKIINGNRVPWNSDDYLKEAKRIVSEEVKL